MKSESTGGEERPDAEELATREAYRTMRSIEWGLRTLHAFSDNGEWNFPHALSAARNIGDDLSWLFGGDSFPFRAKGKVCVPKVDACFKSANALEAFLLAIESVYSLVERYTDEVVDAYVARVCKKEPRTAAPEPPCGEFTARQRELLGKYETVVNSVAEATGDRSSVHIDAIEFGEILKTYLRIRVLEEVQ